MSLEKLKAELKARTKQLEDMVDMHEDQLKKINKVKDSSKELTKKISEKQEELEIKSGKLEYILEEKEALFNKLQLALTDNKELKKELEVVKKKNKTSLFGSIWGLLKRDKYDTIDVSDGKVKKNVDLSKVKDQKTAFNNSKSFITDNPNFDNIDLGAIGVEGIKEKMEEEIQKEKDGDEKNDTDTDTPVRKVSETSGTVEDEEDNDSDDDGEDYSHMLNDIRNNLNMVPK